MKPPWWLGLEPAVADVDCDGVTHRIEWRAGRVHALDHDDAEAEQALAVLGGDNPSYCIALATAWQRRAGAVQLVTLGRRPGEGPVGYPSRLAPKKLPSADAFRSASRRLPSPWGHVSPARSSIERMLLEGQEAAALLALSGPLVDRLVLSAMASCAERWSDDAFRAEHGLRIGAALSARAMPALRRFGEQIGRATPTVTVSPSQPDAGPSATARLEAPDKPLAVTAELPVSWLVDVWGRGISEPGGRLVLAVRDADEGGGELLVDLAEWEQSGPISWELAAVPAWLVRDGDGRWTVRGA
jgi:hypothetical protein